MVLQTNTAYGARAFIGGWATPGETVTVTEGGIFTYSAIADSKGNWKVRRTGVCGCQDQAGKRETILCDQSTCEMCR